MKINPLAFALLASTLAIPAAAVAAPQGPPPPGYGQGGWDTPPGAFRDVQRRGFHDGIEGARKDFENHRPPTPENRDEYRHPPVSRDLRHDYREAFRQGYMVAVQHMGGR